MGVAMTNVCLPARIATGPHTLAILAAFALAFSALPGRAADNFTFASSADFVRDCSGSSPSEECLNAILHVEEVVDYGDNGNATCDGGPEELLKSASNGELNDKLAERLARIIPWLRAHAEYDDKSYGDGVWAALRGVYCP
jgi:hypothetical protein